MHESLSSRLNHTENVVAIPLLAIASKRHFLQNSVRSFDSRRFVIESPSLSFGSSLKQRT